MTENWCSKTRQKKFAMDKESQDTSFVVLQKIDDETILVQEVAVYHCDSCDEDFNTKASLIVHKTEQSILRTRKALRQAEKKQKCYMCGQHMTNLQLIKHQAQCRHLDAQKKQEKKETIRKITESREENKKLFSLIPVNPVNLLDVQKKQEWKETVKNIKTSREEIKKSSANIINILDAQKKEWKETIRKIKKNQKESKKLSTDPIKCDQCNKVFKKERYLNVHKTLHGANAHICHICGAKMTSDYYLRIHIMRHNKQFTEYCEICNKGFYLKANLRNHMNMHNDEKAYVCEICHKSFRNRIYLRTHMKIHSQPETRKKFKCDICNFETFYSYCYKEHMWTHTGESQVACEVCGKLVRRQYMKIHIRMHTGEKPEVCEFCGKAFSARPYLIKHRRTHTGEKPYKCKICEKRFTQRGTLSVHLRRHENPK